MKNRILAPSADKNNKMTANENILDKNNKMTANENNAEHRSAYGQPDQKQSRIF